MYQDKKVIVVMPAYNAATTLERTHAEVIAQDYVDQIIVVDDSSSDNTVEVARKLDKVTVHVHDQNLGYGGNQKTCYRLAMEQGGDIVIMIHPDYQYTPKLIPAMTSLIGNGLYSCVIGSRILGGYALRGGMPWWRYVSNRFLTFAGNLLMGAKLSEYHTGYRAFSRELLETPAAARELGRLRLRQPDAGADPVVRLHHRRGQLPHQVLRRGLLDQLHAQREVRVRLPGHGHAVLPRPPRFHPDRPLPSLPPGLMPLPPPSKGAPVG